MKQLTSYNRVAGYLNKIFDLLNEQYFESTLSRPTITIQSTPRAYGHFSLKTDTWVSAIGNSHEINIGAGTLARPIENVVATLLHEMIHYYNFVNGVFVKRFDWGVAFARIIKGFTNWFYAFQPIIDGLFDFFLIILGVGSANAEAVRNGRVRTSLLQLLIEAREAASLMGRERNQRLARKIVVLKDRVHDHRFQKWRRCQRI